MKMSFTALACAVLLAGCGLANAQTAAPKRQVTGSDAPKSSVIKPSGTLVEARTFTSATRKTCVGAHLENKNFLIDQAKRKCRIEFGSGLAPARDKDYDRVSCDLKKDGIRIESVTVSGRLSFSCS